MREIAREFASIPVRPVDCARGKRYFDPIRKIFTVITPEETVRQKMLGYLLGPLSVPPQYLRVEEHLIHYGVQSYNGRMDIVVQAPDEAGTPKVLAVVECKEENIFIESAQMREQAERYATLVNAPYFCLVNGIHMQFFHRKDGSGYVQIREVPTFAEMTRGICTELPRPTPFQRLAYTSYFDDAFLRSQSWFFDKIGADTPQELIPCIIALDDCLLDDSQKLTALTSSRFSLVEDLGVQYRQYNDRSNGGFGSGEYRIFLVEDALLSLRFLCGFTIITTGKTVDDPKYGTTAGKSVLVSIYNDGTADEMSAQINLNRFLTVSPSKRSLHLTHNGAVSRKGARKDDLLRYLAQQGGALVKDGRIDLGTVEFASPLFFARNDMQQLMTNLIEYSALRDAYKATLSKKSGES